MEMEFKLKIPDIIIIFLVSAITFFSVYNAYMKPQERTQVLIRGLNSEWTFPIEAQEIVVVEGLIGNTIVRIGDNRAWVEFSPCDNKTCISAGLITRQGQWTACLPNGVLVMIQGYGGDDVDTVAW
jgi:hypothetical protein